MKKNDTTKTTIETTADINTTATEVIDLTVYSASELLEMLNDAETTAQANTLKKALAECLKEQNKEAKKIALQTFANTAERDEDLFWECFIEKPYAPTQKLTQNDETSEWEIKDGQTRLTFEEIDRTYGATRDGKTIARSKRYVGMIARFAHNLYLNTCDGLGEEADKDAKPIRVKFRGDDATTIEEFDFSGHSTANLQTQFNAILKTIMPEGGAFLMRKADVRYIREGFTNAKEGKVVTARESTVSKLIWDAVKVRKSGKAYEVNSKAKCHSDK